MQDVVCNKGMLFSSPATNMGWPNSSFGLFHTILWKNLNKLFFFFLPLCTTQHSLENALYSPENLLFPSLQNRDDDDSCLLELLGRVSEVMPGNRPGTGPGTE